MLCLGTQYVISGLRLLWSSAHHRLPNLTPMELVVRETVGSEKSLKNERVGSSRAGRFGDLLLVAVVVLLLLLPCFSAMHPCCTREELGDSMCSFSCRDTL